jgi:hypothetical protein
LNEHATSHSIQASRHRCYCRIASGTIGLFITVMPALEMVVARSKLDVPAAAGFSKILPAALALR